jgi:hypothetical protein
MPNNQLFKESIVKVETRLPDLDEEDRQNEEDDEEELRRQEEDGAGDDEIYSDDMHGS